MSDTTISSYDGKESMILGRTGVSCPPDDVLERYERLVLETRFDWLESHRVLRRLGAGGQGIVFLSERIGADGFRLPVALKVFSPERYGTTPAYEQAMTQMAGVAVRVAQIQQDNLIDVHNFVALDGIRLMEMEWVDGYDLQRLLAPEMLQRARERVNDERWDYLNDVIVTAGPTQSRLKPGVAIAVLRDCLVALSALHRNGIVHGDIKPSNIMLKRTGNAKLVDVGSAFAWGGSARAETFTPGYAAPEILDGHEGTPRADLASLGYVLVELLAGVAPFAGLQDRRVLLEAKQALPYRLPEALPEDVVCNDLLMSLIGGLIAADPAQRFPSAEAADLVEKGAANFHRQLVKGDLASEYDNELRVWLEELE
jgi:serine/threonine-protein kinase